MEHSEEYYKMKYFKYKAKYQEELARQQGGSGIFDKIKAGYASVNTKIDTYNSDKKSAKSAIIKESIELYTKINGSAPVWNKITSFKKLLEEMQNLKIGENPSLEFKGYACLHKDIIVRLKSLCKNVVGIDSIDKECLVGMQ